MPYELATAVSPVTRNLPRFSAAFWSINGPSSAKFSVISTDPTDTTALEVSLKYGLQNDFIGLEWQSTDLYDHPLLKYAANRDYTGVVLSFHIEMDPYSTAIGEPDGPTFTAETWNTPGQMSSGVRGGSAGSQFWPLRNSLVGKSTTIATSMGVPSITHASPSVVTITNPHGLGVGDLVRLSGIAGNTAMNSVNSSTGWWVVQSVGSPTTFTVADPATPTVAINGNADPTASTPFLGIFSADVSIPLSTAFAAHLTDIDRVFISFVPAGYNSVPSSPGILSYPLTPTGGTNASPSVVTTSTPHRLGVSQIVTIASVTGNTALNGTWAVRTVPSSTTLTLENINTGTEVDGNGTFGGSPTMLAYTQLSSTVQITNMAVSGTGQLSLVQGAVGARPHNLRITLGYDDTYNLTPARLFWNWQQLGYRGKINLYTGAGHQFDLRLIYPSSALYYQLNPGSPLNPAAQAWFVDFYQRAKNRQGGASDVVVSLSFEIPYQYADLAWAQCDVFLNPATTGYPSPQTTLCDPCNAAAMAYLVAVLNAHMALQKAIGANLIFQVGEPWIWISTQSNSPNPYIPIPFGSSGYVGGNPNPGVGSALLAPCFYGGAEDPNGYGMLNAFLNNMMVSPSGNPSSGFLTTASPSINPSGHSLTLIQFNSNSLDLYPLAFVPDSTHFPGVQNKAFFDWFRHQMGYATVSIRNGVKAVYPGAKACVLWFPPQVLGTKSYNSGLMSYINYCYEAWYYVLGYWDFIQLEAYGYTGNDYGSSDAPDWPRFNGAETVPLIVSAATNASPSFVFTNLPHGLTTGQTVQISGAVGNTAINGIWMIKYSTAQSFNLLSVTTGVAVVGNGNYVSGSATMNPYFWALPDGNHVSGVLGIFHDALGYPLDVLEFFAGTVPSQNIAETDSQFAARVAADWLYIYISMLYMFNQGVSEVYVWSDSQVRDQGFVFQGEPPVANLQVLGFPTVPSGKILSSASLSTVMLGDYADGAGTRYARQQFGEWDATNNRWKPAGEPDGVYLYLPGANQGNLYPPITQFSYTLVFTDGTQETSEFNQQVIAAAATPGVWYFGTAAAATPTVNLPVGYQSFFLTQGNNISGTQGDWDSTTRSDGLFYYIDLQPLLDGIVGVLAAGFDPQLVIIPVSDAPILIPPIAGWNYDLSAFSALGGRIEILSGYRLKAGETLSLFAALQ